MDAAEAYRLGLADQVIGGSGDAQAVRGGLALFTIDPDWREFVRFNITIECALRSGKPAQAAAAARL